MFGNRVCRECKALEERIQSTESRLSKLETSEVDVLAQLKMIRDKVLRRFQKRDDDQDESYLTSNPFHAK